MVAIMRRSGTMPPISPLGPSRPTTFSPLLPGVCRLISTGLQGQATVNRTHANTSTRRRNPGATGHDEGNAIWPRPVHAGTRAPSESTRPGSVSIVAAAHGVVLPTSWRRVSSHTAAAACRHTRHCLAAQR